MGRFRLAATVAVLALVGASCSSGSGDTSTTTTAPVVTVSTIAGTSLTTVTVTTVPSLRPSTSTTTTLGPPLPELVYSIEARRSGAGGDTVLVLLPPATYTDLDLEEIMLDVVERFAPIAIAYVVDSLDTDGDGLRNPPSGVLDLLTQETAFNPAEVAFLSDHYFVVLQDGFRVVFRGPFADLPPVILGS